MTDSRRPVTCPGFTLLEILVAIFIFSLVMVAVYGAYSTSSSVIDSTESLADINTKARIAMERITADLGSFYHGQGELLAGRKQEILGHRADTLRFSSTAHVSFTAHEELPGLAMIGYLVTRDPKTGFLQLYRLDIPYKPGYFERDYSNQKGYLLSDGLRSVEFTYVDQEGNEADEWRIEEDGGEKDEKRKMPVMIGVTLRYADQDREDQVFTTAVALPADKVDNGQDG